MSGENATGTTIGHSQIVTPWGRHHLACSCGGCYEGSLPMSLIAMQLQPLSSHQDPIASWHSVAAAPVWPGTHSGRHGRWWWTRDLPQHTQALPMRLSHIGISKSWLAYFGDPKVAPHSRGYMHTLKKLSIHPGIPWLSVTYLVCLPCFINTIYIIVT